MSELVTIVRDKIGQLKFFKVFLWKVHKPCTELQAVSHLGIHLIYANLLGIVRPLRLQS